MAARLTRFWQAIESFPALAAVAAEWRAVLGAEFDLVQPFLRPRPELAASFPHFDGAGAGLPYRVVCHGGDAYVGVCPETGDTIALTTGQLVVFELDRQRLATNLADALGINGGAGLENWTGQAIRLGRFNSAAEICYSAFLSFPFESEDVHAIAAQLVAEKQAPFLLFAPSRRWLRRAAETILRSHGCVFLALADAVVAPRPGRLERVQTLEALIERAAGVAREKAADGVAGGDAQPPGANRGKAPQGHKLRFEHGAFIYKEVREELSGKPLRILEAIAKAAGNALSAAELRERCWEANSDVGDEAIRSHVSDARAALRRVIRAAKATRRQEYDPLPVVDRGEKRTAWRLQLP